MPDDPDPVAQYLRSLNIPDSVRAMAWDATWADDDATAEAQLRKLPKYLAPTVLEDLWNLRTGGALSADVKPYQTPKTDDFLAPGAAPAPRPSGPQRLAGVGIETVSDADWDKLTPGERLQGVLKATGYAVSGALGMGAEGRGAVDNPKTTLALAAVPVVGKAVGPLIPTRAKAAEKFAEVARVVNQQPVDVARTGDVALRIADLAQRGGGTLWGPAPVRQFIQYVTDPRKPQMTYEVARDFYSNISRLSADEVKRMAPTVRRELGGLREALKEALAKTAASGGKEKVFRAAMREYRIASQAHEIALKAAKWTAGAVGLGAATKAGQAVGIIPEW